MTNLVLNDHRDAPDGKEIYPFEDSPLSTTAPCLIVTDTDGSIAYIFKPVGKTKEYVIYYEVLAEPTCARTPRHNSKFLLSQVRELLEEEHGITITN